MARWFLLGTLLLALGLLLILAPSDTTAVRTRKTGAKLFGGNDGYQELNEADEDDDEYTAEDQASPDEDCEDGSCEEAALPDKRRGRRVVRKAGPRGGRQQARRKMGHRMYLGEDDMKLKDSPGSWHWYLLWGSLLMGTLAVTGGGASYAYLVMKSQFLDKLKPGLMNVEKEMAPFEREIMDLKDLFKPEEIEKGYQWCQDKGLMPKYCPDCNEVMELSCKIKDDTCLGYCSTCQSTCNALTGTWFEISGMDPWSAIALLFYWSVGYSYPQTASRLGMTAADARAAYAKCVRFSEESMALCKDELYVDAPPHHYLEHQHQTCPLFKIGGKGKKVEVGIVGKNQLVKDHFAIVGVEVGTWRCFLVPTPVVNAQVVDYVMHQRIREGSVVYHPLSLYHGGERPQYLPQVFLPENTAVASTAERKPDVEHVEKLRDEMRANVPELLSVWDYHVFVVQYMYNRKYWFSPTESFRRVLEHIAQIYQKKPEMSL